MVNYNMVNADIKKILGSIPPNVKIVAACKKRIVTEIEKIIDEGIDIIGHSYVQEAVQIRNELKKECTHHFIGHLQTNKVKLALNTCDLIQTLDSIKLAKTISRYAVSSGKKVPILIEINSGRENNKSGIYPENAEELIKEIISLENLLIKGIMTMGLYTDNDDLIRECFRETKAVFDLLSGIKSSKVTAELLSMGMSDSYEIAIEEGANMIRLGGILFEKT